MLPKDITGHPDFPCLKKSNHQVTSPMTPLYNCIAWALGEDGVWWWPDSTHQSFWPDGVKREVTVDAFAEAFATKGYELCDNGNFERGYHKIVLYLSAFFEPTHAAKQIDKEYWSSKLGQAYDISHELDALDSVKYGQPKFFFRKKL